jgi:protein SCO1/2
MADRSAMRRHHRAATTATALLAVGALTLAACGSDDPATDDPGSVSTDATSDTASADATTDTAGPERELAGIVREPAPVVDATNVPSLTNPGTDVVFRAEPGGFQAVYFGYTNCPDVCPTTMADWAITMRRLPEDLAARLSTGMVTVDPDRDNDILPGYIESFVADAEAAGTTDADLLAAAAAPFGVSYDVTTNDEGEIEVSHSGFLYLVDDQGRLAVTWPFGTSSTEMAADIEQLFAAQGAA